MSTNPDRDALIRLAKEICPDYREEWSVCPEKVIRDRLKVMTQMAFYVSSVRTRPPLTHRQAITEGFTVDRTCYPWIGYKGPRFAPTEMHEVFTDLETGLRSELQICQEQCHQNAEIKRGAIEHALDAIFPSNEPDCMRTKEGPTFFSVITRSRSRFKSALSHTLKAHLAPEPKPNGP